MADINFGCDRLNGWLVISEPSLGVIFWDDPNNWSAIVHCPAKLTSGLERGHQFYTRSPDLTGGVIYLQEIIITPFVSVTLRGNWQKAKYGGLISHSSSFLFRSSKVLSSLSVVKESMNNWCFSKWFLWIGVCDLRTLVLRLRPLTANWPPMPGINFWEISVVTPGVSLCGTCGSTPMTAS